MKRVLPWIGLGLLAAAAGSATFACSSNSGGSGGAGGGVIDGGGTGGGGTGGTSGTGATAGTGATDGGVTSRLGRQCTNDSECGSGLTCVTASSTVLDGEGAARGICTATCATNADCDALSPGAGCVQNKDKTAYCFQACTWKGTNGNYDPTTCYGRPEVACAGYISNPEASTTADTFLCTPTCNADTDCGSGLYCNYGTGHCSTTKPTGEPVGVACNPKNATDPCAGFCIGYGDPDPTKGICAGVCTIGALGTTGSCGSDPTPGSPQAAACLFVEDQKEGLGDLGFCGQLCDCDSQCAGGFVCSAWDLSNTNQQQIAQLVNRVGLCVTVKNSEGGVNPGTPQCPSTNDGGAGAAGSAGASGSAGAAGTGGSAGASAGAAGSSDAGTD